MSLAGGDLSRIALQLSLFEGQSRWGYLVAGDAVGEVAREVQEFCEDFLQQPAVLVDAAEGVEATLRRLGSEDRVCVVFGVETWGEADWHALDVGRTRLQQVTQPRLWVMSRGGLDALLSLAPHTASFFQRELVADERKAPSLVEARLASYESKFAMKGDAAILLAERDEAPTDPDFGAWLCLLGRGDLVGRG